MRREKIFARAEPPLYVALVCDNAQLFADEIELDRSTDILRASGHVAFIEGSQRITADRIEFNTRTKLGSFWNAQGIMEIAGKADPLGDADGDRGRCCTSLANASTRSAPTNTDW